MASVQLGRSLEYVEFIMSEAALSVVFCISPVLLHCSVG